MRARLAPGGRLARRTLLGAGLAVLAAAWLGPLPELARDAFWAHMTMHMAVVAVAAPLIALGVAGGRLDPARRWPALLAPVPMSALELVVVWAWHAPALHHAARHGAVGMAAEQGSFLAAGLAVWLSAFGGERTAEPALRRGRAAAGIVGLLLTAMHMTLLGALLALATRPLYHAGAAAAGGVPPWGLTLLADQHLGGAIMLLGGGTVYLAGGLALAATLVRWRLEDGPALGEPR